MKGEKAVSPMSHQERQDIQKWAGGMLRIGYAIFVEYMEKTSKVQKKVSWVMIIVSGAFITLISSLPGFKEDGYSLHKLAVLVESCSIIFGVVFYLYDAKISKVMNRPHDFRTSEPVDQLFGETNRTLRALKYCYRIQVGSFMLAFGILVWILVLG